jgi:hypothetical protein
MRFEGFSFGRLVVDGQEYTYDLIVDRGELKKRRKKPSKKFRGDYGHTPVSVAEDLPWKCKALVIGTGASGALPVMPQVLEEAERRRVRITAVPTEQAIAILNRSSKNTNAVIHVTC